MPDKKPTIEDFIAHSIRVKVNRYIDAHGITKLEFARRTHIAAPTINHLTNYDTMPSLRSVIMLSLVMGVSVDRLCGADMIRERMRNNGSGR